jgi:uncharacterized protein (UPF0335 family)
MEDTKLVQFIQRIERVNEEIAGLQTDVRDLLKEAKGEGYDVKAIREIIKLRKMMKADRAEFEYLRDQYKKLMGMED